MLIIDYPFTTIKNGYTLWPVKCGVTKKWIPMFTKAKRRWIEFESKGQVYHDFDWVSLEGYTYLVLTKKPGEVFYE